MSAGVFTPHLRFRWVTGWETGGTDPADGSVECGDYTLFPMEVTGASVSDKLDKIAEIYYRVKMAQFTENTIAGTLSFSSGVTSGTISPRVMYSYGGGLSDNFLMSGYYTQDEAPLEVYAAAIPYLGSQYTEEYVPGPGFVATGTFRDILDNERGVWLPNVAGSSPRWNDPVGTFSTSGFATAFSWYSNSAAGSLTQPDIPIPWVSAFLDPDTIYESLEMGVSFGGRVAVVYGGDVGDLHHPDNRFFIELVCMENTGIFGFTTASIDPGWYSTSAEYTIRLSTGDLSCPLASTDSALTGSLVHEAVEWWPYNRLVDPTAVWDTATGEKLPDEVVFAAFDNEDQQDQIFHII